MYTFTMLQKYWDNFVLLESYIMLSLLDIDYQGVKHRLPRSQAKLVLRMSPIPPENGWNSEVGRPIKII